MRGKSEQKPLAVQWTAVSPELHFVPQAARRLKALVVAIHLVLQLAECWKLLTAVPTCPRVLQMTGCPKALLAALTPGRVLQRAERLKAPTASPAAHHVLQVLGHSKESTAALHVLQAVLCLRKPMATPPTLPTCTGPAQHPAPSRQGERLGPVAASG
mmetsp:Transcript_61185/g.197112  ORF Transcript_61185/g.197112 Transcript_61185/m.197112 type:complete len:158 (-) Transcript_61185:277-750(-)